MLQKGFQGFCMALADSVPGVSGGTVAFIMGFYDRFIGSINDLAFQRGQARKEALLYLIKLGIGWIIGMGASVFVLAGLFQSHIYIVSSLFIGFIIGAVPLICREEADSLKEWKKGIAFGVAGLLLVVLITWLNGRMGTASINLHEFSAGLGIRLFLTGMIAISAMFLPGISGSTLLLILGAYIPVITAVKGFLSMDFMYIPGLFCFGLGVLTGAFSVVRGIKLALERYRPQAVYAILGMMVGSLYAIVMGATTLDVPQAPLGIGSFHIVACLAGIALLVGMELLKEKSDRQVQME